MAIYQQCPKCHRKQARKNETCRACGLDLKKAHRQKKIIFWVYLRYRGRQVWERIGWSLTVARDREKKLKEELTANEYIPITEQATLEGFFLGSYLPAAKQKKRSWDKDNQRFKNHLFPYFGDIKLSDISVSMVEDYKTHRLDQGAKNSTVNRDLALLRAMLNRAAKMGLFKGENPVRIAGLLPENNLHVARALTEEEAQRLLAAMKADVRPIFEFALASGIRIGNILSLKWEQVDFTHRMITLPKTKSGKSLKLPLNDWAAKIIREKPRHLRSSYVFCKLNGKPYTTLRKGFKSALKTAGLDQSIRIHDLRHTAATWLAASGVPTSILKDLLGHSSMAMVSRYSHSGHATLLEMSNRITSPFVSESNQYANNQE